MSLVDININTNMYICYQWKCEITGKNYVGITNKSIQKRFVEHVGAANRGSKQVFHRAIRKHGKSAFKGTILRESTDRENIMKAEAEFIIELGSMCEQNGYNMTTGGEYPNISEELKKQLSVSAYNRKPVTNETKKKLSNSLKGNKNRVGYKASETTLIKMRNAVLGNKQSKATVDLKSGKNHYNAKQVNIEGMIFDTIQEAAKELNIPRATMYHRVHSSNKLYSKYYIITEKTNEALGN